MMVSEVTPKNIAWKLRKINLLSISEVFSERLLKTQFLALGVHAEV